MMAPSRSSPVLCAAALFARFALAAPAVLSEVQTFDKRQTTHDLFKGDPIPDVNWTSTDIHNFTWGLTGVDNYENFAFAFNLWYSLAGLMGALLLYRLCVLSYHKVRHIATVGHAQPLGYFSQPLGGIQLFFQKHIVDAPLLSRRHNDPLQFRPLRLHFGTLPSRVNGIFLFLYVLSNILYCTLYLPWNGSIGPDGKLHEPTKAALVAEFRGRTGVMAVVNMIPLFVCMLRNNYLGSAVGVGFNSWNLFHRWLGRIVVIESWAHMGAWMVNKLDQSDWSNLYETIMASNFLKYGMLGELALLCIMFLSMSPIRHSHYQFFLTTHQILIVMFLVGIFMHCWIDELPQILWVYIAIGVWVFERCHRIFTIYLKNVRLSRRGVSCSTAEVTPVGAGEQAVHVAIKMKKGWKYKPGTHVYLYLPRLGWTQSHPFSVAWSTAVTPVPDTIKDDKPSSSTVELTPTRVSAPESTTIHFVIARREGFTKRLYDSVAPLQNADPEKPPMLPTRQYTCFVEGPYSNESFSFESFSTLLFIAGGSGITHPLGHIRELLINSAQGLVSARRIKLAWIVPDLDNYAWVSEWLEDLWEFDAGRGILEVQVYVTRPKPTPRVPRGTKAKFFSGRPVPDTLLEDLATPKVGTCTGAISVNVCGPGGLADSYREAARNRVESARIEYSEESFTWS